MTIRTSCSGLRRWRSRPPGPRSGFAPIRAAISLRVHDPVAFDNDFAIANNQRLDLVASDGTTETGAHYNLDGWRAGVGLEQSLGGKAYAKVEYRYSNYGQARLEYPSGGNTNNFSVDTDRHQLVAGVGVRF